MTTYAVLSTTNNHDYDFLAPITCRLWKDVVGYEPIMLFADKFNGELSVRSNTVIRECDEHGAKIVFVHEGVSGVSIQHIAQVSRLFAAAAQSLSPDDILMTADVDMWPLQRKFFEIMDAEKVNLYGSNVYAAPRSPMCYVAAKVRKWREMMRIPDRALIQQAIDGIEWNHARLWDTDEDLLEEALIRNGGRSACAMRDRIGSRHGFMGNRVDRGRWIYNGKEDGLIDAHLPRPGYEAWDRLRPLLVDYCPQIVDWADDWKRRYLEVFDK